MTTIAPEKNGLSDGIPYQEGRIAVVTGASGGIGFEIAKALALAGATVIMAARDRDKSQDAMRRIKDADRRSTIRFEHLDLASLASVADFSHRIREKFDRVDILINNAGVMALPQRRTTTDGFEQQFGVNFLAHFALSARLLPHLRQSKSPRIVTLSSVVHKAGKLDFDDLQWEKRRYSPNGAYHASKLANLMFALELQRRSDRADWGLKSIAAHPGLARTSLMANGPGLENLAGRLFSLIVQPIFSHSAAEGALPALVAATAPDADGGGYYGPSRLFELKGPPAKAKIAPRAMDTEVARHLWDVAEELTGVRFA